MFLLFVLIVSIGNCRLFLSSVEAYRATSSGLSNVKTNPALSGVIRKGERAPEISRLIAATCLLPHAALNPLLCTIFQDSSGSVWSDRSDESRRYTAPFGSGSGGVLTPDWAKQLPSEKTSRNINLRVDDYSPYWDSWSMPNVKTFEPDNNTAYSPGRSVGSGISL